MTAPARNTWAPLFLVPSNVPDENRADLEPIINPMYLRTVARGRFPKAIRKWLRLGAIAYLKGGGAETMDSCLGLAPLPTRRKWQTTEAYQQRNQRLITALGLVTGGANELSKAIALFADDKWQRWRALPALPQDASPLDLALFDAFQCTNDMRKLTGRRLQQIAKQAGACCFAAADPGTFELFGQCSDSRSNQRLGGAADER